MLSEQFNKPLDGTANFESPSGIPQIWLLIANLFRVRCVTNGNHWVVWCLQQLQFSADLSNLAYEQ